MSEEINELSNTVLKILCIKDEITYEWSNIISKLNRLDDKLIRLNDDIINMKGDNSSHVEQVKTLKDEMFYMKEEMRLLKMKDTNGSQVGKYQCIVFTNTLKSTVNSELILNKSFSYKMTVKNRISKTFNEDSHWMKNYTINEIDFKDYHHKIMSIVSDVIIQDMIVKQERFPFIFDYQNSDITIKLEINSEEILLNTYVNTYRMRDIVGWLCQDILFDNSRKIQKYLL